MKTAATWILGLACIVSPWAQAREGGTVWQGTLGRQAVVVEREAAGGDGRNCGGHYFYRRYRLDITLDGEAAADGRCSLQELPPRWGDEPKNVWRMQAPKGDRWQGEWIGTDGRRLPIALSRVRDLPPAAESSLTALRGDFPPYAYLRLSMLRLQPQRREVVNGRVLQWWRQPEADIALFDIASGYAPEPRARINHTLHRRLWEWVDSVFTCRSGLDDGSPGFDAAKATVREVNDAVVSASLFTSFYCGGAHPDFGDAPVNIDARTGRDLRLEDVLWVGEGAPVFEGKSGAWNEDWSRYRSVTFAPWVVVRFERLYPQPMKPPAEEGGCDYRDPGVWSFPAWYVTPKGIHLAAYFPRVARNCDDPDWAVVPWPMVDAHRGPIRLH